MRGGLLDLIFLSGRNDKKQAAIVTSLSHQTDENAK
jgi:hypothetical protein